MLFERVQAALGPLLTPKSFDYAPKRWSESPKLCTILGAIRSWRGFHQVLSPRRLVKLHVESAVQALLVLISSLFPTSLRDFPIVDLGNSSRISLISIKSNGSLTFIPTKIDFTRRFILTTLAYLPSHLETDRSIRLQAALLNCSVEPSPLFINGVRSIALTFALRNLLAQ